MPGNTPSAHRERASLGRALPGYLRSISIFKIGRACGDKAVLRYNIARLTIYGHVIDN